MSNYQNDILSKLSALKKTNSIPPFESENRRNNQNGGFIDFLFTLIKQLSGQEGFKNIIFRSVLGELNQPTNINTLIRNIFKKNYFCELDFKIPQKYTTESVNGITIPISNIDISGILNIDPNSKNGANFYEGNDPNKHMNFLIYQSQFTDKNNPVNFSGANGVLFELYSDNNENIIFKFGSFYKNKSFSIWAEDFFESTTFFNGNNFLTTLINSLFGSGYVVNGNSSNEVTGIERIVRGLEKLFGFCGGSNNYNYNPNATTTTPVIDSSGNNFLNENITSDDLDEDVFDFNDNELTEIELAVNNKLKGQYKFETCGDLNININPEQVFNKLNDLFSGRYDGNNYDNELTNINIDETTNFFDDLLKEGSKDAIDRGEDEVVINFNNMLDELQGNIIKSIPYMLVNNVLSPKIMMFLYVANVITNSENQDSNSETILNSIKGVLTSIGIFMAGNILNNITKQILKDLSNLAKRLATEFLRQRAIDFANILSIITGLFDNNNNNLDTCGGAISSILGLLNGNITTPAGTIPHIVIPVINQVKTGLNHVGIINDVKSRLERKGIETAAFYPDGTPNYQMYMMEETVKSLVQHIKLNSKIDVGGFAGPFPVVGAAQII